MKLYLPDPSITGKYAHVQDSFRELATMWADNNWVDLDYSKQLLHPVLHTKHLQVCLYDRDLSTQFNWQQGIPCDHVLWGNPAPQGDFPYESTWIMWGRHPRQLHAATQQPRLDYHNRPTISIFAGKIENPTQHNNRTQSGVDWSKYIEDFSCPINGNRKYSQQQYLQAVARSRYGLCLPGYGNKCNREIELMALGTVPIITPGVDIINYYRPPQENTHYITATSGEELQHKIHSITPAQWNHMSESCVAWYEENCSPEGSFKTTQEIIQGWL